MADAANEVILARVVNGAIVSGDDNAAPVLWWSFGKTALAAAVLTFVRDGRADLDAKMPDGPFTLRQVLQHRAGLPDYGNLPIYRQAVAGGQMPWSDDEFIARTMRDERIPHPELGRFFYSNIGYLFVRRFLEAALGQPIGELLQERLFGPLDIRNVRQAITPADLLQTQWGNASSYHPGWVAHGLLIGPLASAALFLDRLITSPLIPPALLKEMRGSVIVGGPIAGRPFVQPSYGLGVMMDPKAPAGRMVGHTGAGPGGVIAVYRFPDGRPDATIAAASPASDEGIVEWAAVRAAQAAD